MVVEEWETPTRISPLFREDTIKEAAFELRGRCLIESRISLACRLLFWVLPHHPAFHWISLTNPRASSIIYRVFLSSAE